MQKRKLKKNIRTKSLDPANMPRVRAELLDYDKAFLKDLKENHPEEYLYLAQFTDEYVGANVRKTKGRKRKDGTKIYGSGKIRKGHLHDTPELAQSVYQANNDRNNDVLSVSKANNLASDVVSEIDKKDGWYVTNIQLTEDALISQIEEKNSTESVLSYEEYLEVKDNLTPEMLMFYLALYEP